MKHHIISKYNPAKRDENRVYLDADEEWSEACEIGRTFKGKKFTIQEYLETEEQYIKAILAFYDASGLSHLRMTNPSTTDLVNDEQFQEWKIEYPQLYEPIFEQTTFADDRIINRDELVILIKMNLRQFSYCRLEVIDKFYLHFGYDSYVHIQTAMLPESLGSANGIYVEVENALGPYMAKGKIEVLVDKFDPKEGYVTEGDMTILAHVPRLQIRDLLGYSSEHPFATHMEITPEIAEKLTSLTDYKFDFDNFGYSMSTYGDGY